MGQYLLAKLGRRIKKDFPGHISTTMLVFDELIVACPEHLPLFGSSVVAAIKLLLTSRPQSSHLAIATWTKYLECEQDLTRLDWEFFIQYFMKMIDAKQPAEVRRDGLVGLAAFVSETEDFDGLAARYISTATDTQPERMHNILWKVLISTDDVSDGMRAVLNSFGGRLNAATLRTCLSIVTRLFSTQEMWTKVDFVTETLILVSGGAQKTHLRETVIFLAEYSETETNFAVQTLIVRILMTLVENGVSSPILDVILPLYRQKENRSDAIILLLAETSDAEKFEACNLIMGHENGEEKKSRKLVSEICSHYSLEDGYEQFAGKSNIVARFLKTKDHDDGVSNLDLFPLDAIKDSADAPLLKIQQSAEPVVRKLETSL